jgi:hypothetical protein
MDVGIVVCVDKRHIHIKAASLKVPGLEVCDTGECRRRFSIAHHSHSTVGYTRIRSGLRGTRGACIGWAPNAEVVRGAALAPYVAAHAQRAFIQVLELNAGYSSGDRDLWPTNGIGDRCGHRWTPSTEADPLV